MLKTALAAAALFAMPVLPSFAADWAKVADALGKSGTEMPGGEAALDKINLARS